MNEFKNIRLNPNSTIKDALKIISDGKIQIALVVDKSNRLLGTLTDGDIRRGLLKGLALENSIKSIFFKKPLFLKKNQTKESILKKAFLKKIHQIPVIDHNQKVIGIHILSELIKPRQKKNKVILMAGGIGERLLPLTKKTPKPMLKVGNKPVLQTIVEKFAESGYTNLVMCVNYRSKIIQKYFGDGTKFGVKIDYIIEKNRMGTAGALSLWKDKPDESFFVMNADLLTNLDFDKILDFHEENKAMATMCVREYSIQSPYGEVNLRNENIISITEKPMHKFFVNAGIYVLNPECLGFIPKKFYDMPLLFKDLILKKKKIISFPVGEYWLDIGRLNDYKKANSEYHSIFSKL